MKFAARRVAAESKRGEPRRTSAKFFVKRVFRETFVFKKAAGVSGEFFFTSGARRAPTPPQRGGESAEAEKNESRGGSLTYWGWVVGI